MRMKRLLAGLAVAATGAALVLALAAPEPAVVSAGRAVAQTPALLVEYPVPGNPENVAVEASNRVWFSLPPQNLIGRLVVTSSVDYSVVTYTVPTPNSTPYDLAYAGGAVWFTERDGNKIGRLDTTTGTILEYQVPTPDSEPTGIDVLSGPPTRVWFTERAADQVSQLVVTDTSTTSISEYAIPDPYAGAAPQDVDIRDASTAWFSAPGVGCIGKIQSGSFDPLRCLSEGEPWSIAVASGGLPVWFTDRDEDRVGAYYPTTITFFRFYYLPAGGEPDDLVLGGDSLWSTQRSGQNLAQLDLPAGVLREFSVGASLGGLDVDGDDHVWFAEPDAMKIGEWRPPYFRRTYLPLAMRS